MVREKDIEKAMVSILEAIGEDPERDGLRDTPKRVARMFDELFGGVGIDPVEAFTAIFENESSGDPIVVRDIPFFSVCEHHILPFFGHAHIGYIPKDKITGVSKLVRALEVVAHRPQLQERMTAQLADAIQKALSPYGVAVILEAEHLCMSMRGVKRGGSLVLTTATRGLFRNSSISREGLLALVQGKTG